MQTTQKHSVLVEVVGSSSRSVNVAEDLFLIFSGVLLLAASAKIAVPMWPVPITMGTCAVLSLGAAYGPRLGLATALLGHEASPPFPDSESALFQNAVRKQAWR